MADIVIQEWIIVIPTRPTPIGQSFLVVLPIRLLESLPAHPVPHAPIASMLYGQPLKGLSQYRQPMRFALIRRQFVGAAKLGDLLALRDCQRPPLRDCD